MFNKTRFRTQSSGLSKGDDYNRILTLFKSVEIPVLVFMEISGVVNALMFIGVEKI